MKGFMFFLFLGLASSDKLDRTYLPPPWFKLSGGSPGDIQAPLEFPKKFYSTTLQPVTPKRQEYHLMEDTHTTYGIDKSVNFPTTKELKGQGLDDFAGNKLFHKFNVPSITSFAATTLPIEGFETTVSPPGHGDFVTDSSRNQQNLDSDNYPIQGQVYSQQPTVNEYNKPNQFPTFAPNLNSSYQHGYQARVPDQFQHHQDHFSSEKVSPTPGLGTQSPSYTSQATLNQQVSHIGVQPPYQFTTERGTLPFNPQQVSLRPNSQSSIDYFENKEMNTPGSIHSSISQEANQRPLQFFGHKSQIPITVRPNTKINKHLSKFDKNIDFGLTIQSSPQGNRFLQGSLSPISPDFIEGSVLQHVIPENFSYVNNYKDSRIKFPFSSVSKPENTSITGESKNSFQPNGMGTSSHNDHFQTTTIFPTSTFLNTYSSTTPAYQDLANHGTIKISEVKSRTERPQVQTDRNAVILNYESTSAPEGYAYNFDTSNGIHVDVSGTADNGVKAQGSYSYTGDDGKIYEVIYSADENGFQPRGDHLPTSPPIPEAIKRVIEQAAMEKAAGIFDDGSYDEKKYGHKIYEQDSFTIPKEGYISMDDTRQFGKQIQTVHKDNTRRPISTKQDFDRYDDALDKIDSPDDTEAEQDDYKELDDNTKLKHINRNQLKTDNHHLLTAGRKSLHSYILSHDTSLSNKQNKGTEDSNLAQYNDKSIESGGNSQNLKYHRQKGNIYRQKGPNLPQYVTDSVKQDNKKSYINRHPFTPNSVKYFESNKSPEGNYDEPLTNQSVHDMRKHKTEHPDISRNDKYKNTSKKVENNSKIKPMQQVLEISYNQRDHEVNENMGDTETGDINLIANKNPLGNHIYYYDQSKNRPPGIINYRGKIKQNYEDLPKTLDIIYPRVKERVDNDRKYPNKPNHALDGSGYHYLPPLTKFEHGSKINKPNYVDDIAQTLITLNESQNNKKGYKISDDQHVAPLGPENTNKIISKPAQEKNKINKEFDYNHDIGNKPLKVKSGKKGTTHPPSNSESPTTGKPLYNVYNTPEENERQTAHSADKSFVDTESTVVTARPSRVNYYGQQVLTSGNNKASSKTPVPFRGLLQYGSRKPAFEQTTQTQHPTGYGFSTEDKSYSNFPETTKTFTRRPTASLGVDSDKISDLNYDTDFESITARPDTNIRISSRPQQKSNDQAMSTPIIRFFSGDLNTSTSADNEPESTPSPNKSTSNTPTVINFESSSPAARPGYSGGSKSSRPGIHGNLPSTTYRPNYVITEKIQSTPQYQITDMNVDMIGKPISLQPYHGNIIINRPGSSDAVIPVTNYQETDLIGPNSGIKKHKIIPMTVTSAIQYPNSRVTYLETLNPNLSRTGNTNVNNKDQHGTNPLQKAYSESQSTGEDFSGPSRLQKFDPETGYHY